MWWSSTLGSHSGLEDAKLLSILGYETVVIRYRDQEGGSASLAVTATLEVEFGYADLP